MAKKKASDRLKVLLRLAEMKEQNAARQLAADTERLQQAREQSRQLAVYEQDYQRDFVDRGALTLDRQSLENYHGFFRQLEHIQVQQQRTVDLRDREREVARLRWIEQYSRRKLLTQIRAKRLATEQLKADKKLQGEIDDHTARKQLTLAAEKQAANRSDPDSRD
jgi:flagellar FliJ protein